MIVHSMQYSAPEQEITFVRDISIEQKILSIAQKHKIFTDSQEFISDLYEKGKENKVGRPPKNKKYGPTGPNFSNHNTNEEIGKQIGTSIHLRQFCGKMPVLMKVVTNCTNNKNAITIVTTTITALLY